MSGNNLPPSIVLEMPTSYSGIVGHFEFLKTLKSLVCSGAPIYPWSPACPEAWSAKLQFSGLNYTVSAGNEIAPQVRPSALNV